MRHPLTASVMLSCLLVMTPARAQDAATPSERAPGLLLKLYDIAQDMQALPQLIPGELPNVVETISTIDIPEGGFFGRKDHFLVHIEGFLTIEKRADFTVQLISDDGARLWIDDRLIIDHDGLHGPEPKGAGLNLTSGVHTLRVEYFENTGGETLRLLWRGPGDAELRPIPPEILSHDATASRATAPGPKRLIAPLRRGLPGDGRHVAGFHPMENSISMRALGRDREEYEWMKFGRFRSATDRRAQTTRPLIGWVFPERPGGLNPTISAIESDNYAGQYLLVGPMEVFRFMPETVDGQMQGCAVRFSYQGMDLPRVTPRDSIFEMRTVRALRNGLEVEFTQPLDPRVGWEPDSYHVEQWSFDAAGPPLPSRDGVVYPVKSASVSEDRRRVFLEVEGLKAGHIVYLRLLPPCISEQGERPWATEAWYTLNALPQATGQPRQRPPQPPQNVLSPEEEQAGWRLLFDGRTADGWRGFKLPNIPVGPDGTPGWHAIDGCLVRTGPGGDIITEEQFDNFELSLEWRTSAAGNSGIFYRVAEGPEFQYVWQTGPEMQVLDNAEHRDGQSSLTSAGANYGLHAVPKDVTRPVGLFNEARIVVRGRHVEHWLNGEKLIDYELGGPDWEQRVAGSKFAAMKSYGRMPRGHMALQDHGDRVWYRNIKIRPLPAKP